MQSMVATIYTLLVIVMGCPSYSEAQADDKTTGVNNATNPTEITNATSATSPTDMIDKTTVTVSATLTPNPTDDSKTTIIVAACVAGGFLCTCVLFMACVIKWNSSRDNVSVKKISRQKRQRQERKNKKKSKNKKSRDKDLEDGVLPPPIPPHTSDMYIPATVSSTSTASTQSTSLDDDTAVTDSVFGDNSMTGTPIQAHIRTITFTATIENVPGVDVDSAPPIPPRTNEMHFLVNNTSAGCKTASLSDNLRRGCFIADELVVGRNSDTESRLAQDEYETDGYCEPADDTSSQSSIDIGFPPPIPPKTCDMFLVESSNPNDCTTVHIPMKLNGSYIPVTKTAVS